MLHREALDRGPKGRNKSAADLGLLNGSLDRGSGAERDSESKPKYFPSSASYPQILFGVTAANGCRRRLLASFSENIFFRVVCVAVFY